MRLNYQDHAFPYGVVVQLSFSILAWVEACSRRGYRSLTYIRRLASIAFVIPPKLARVENDLEISAPLLFAVFGIKCIFSSVINRS